MLFVINLSAPSLQKAADGNVTLSLVIFGKMLRRTSRIESMKACFSSLYS